MDTRRHGEISVLHIEPATYAKLLHLADTGLGRQAIAAMTPRTPGDSSSSSRTPMGAGFTPASPRTARSKICRRRCSRSCARRATATPAGSCSTRTSNPLLDLPVFEHPDGPHRPGRGGAAPTAPTRVVFSYPVPVCVVVEDGLVSDVVVIDEADVAYCTLVEGDPANLADAVAAATDGQEWPSWRFGW